MIDNLELVIFDMDGLMFDTERLHYEATLRAFRELKVEVDAELLKGSIGTQKFDIYSIILDPLPPDFDVREYLRTTRELYIGDICEKGVPKKPGLDEIIKLLKDKQIKLALGTSTPRDRAERYLNSVEMLELFDYTVTGSDITHTKPHPEIFLKACKQALVKPEKALVLEDSINGAKAAFKAGIRFIIVPDLVEPNQEVIETAYAIVDSLYDVPPLLFD